MEKRFFLALILTALVVILTPMLFPRPKVAPGGGGGAGGKDSTARPAAGQRAAGQSAAAAPTTPAPGRQVEAAPRAAAPKADTSAVAAAETTVVKTPLAEYRFSSIGAAPVQVTLEKYRAFDVANGQVMLARPGEPILRYRVVTPRDTIALDRTAFRVEHTRGTNGADVLRYSAVAGAAQVAITYSFLPDSYLVRVSGQVTAPGVDSGYLLADLPPGLKSSEADSVDDQTHLAFAVKPQADNARGIPFGKLDPGERRLEPGPLTWVAAKNKYFIVGLLTPEKGGKPFAELSAVGGPRSSRRATHATATAVQSLAGGTFGFELYTGPQEWRRLHALGRGFENSNPYGGFLQGIVQPFATIIMRILLWMRDNLKLNYGWVLVIFGIAVRLILWPLNQRAMRTSLKMQRIQPELTQIQTRYKNDPQKLQAEMMRVYKEHGMSPFSTFSGCLPMLLPMPVFFALFFVFQNTIEFRGVPFLWLHDISRADPYFILPLAMGVSMFVLSWIGMRNSPPNPQAKMMSYMMPVMFTVFLLRVAAGLNLYYAVQNLASLPQQWLLSNERAKAAKT